MTPEPTEVPELDDYDEDEVDDVFSTIFPDETPEEPT
jgi:hypothetical protein